ncbi:GNAT family N-acetyltransferase [Ferrimonas sediminicola]|uniref:GNAT family N-acetyltransferase n=1 Tax=Ferrimonas sediminicola TaxID=2569538 RepID=A0A4U1BFN2_9GAMM|nr:GNAT family N-acetyltransferase [Ferrimonas sediminicola]TKB49497.1 GNAT family N-acetyltransferase [Ferrimonas sediminicola]
MVAGSSPATPATFQTARREICGPFCFLRSCPLVYTEPWFHLNSQLMFSISIRPMVAADLAPVAEIYRQRSCVENSLHTPFVSEEEWRARLQQMGSDLQCLVAVANDRVVGHACLITFGSEPRRRHAASLGVVVHSEFRRQGFARALLTELIDTCDSWLGITRIELEVFASNPGAIALYRSLGFVEEGRMRGFAYRNGRLEDAVLMARYEGMG